MKNEKTLLNGTAILAGVCFLLYSLYNLGLEIFEMFGEDYYFNLAYIVFITSILILGITFLFKKKNMLMPVLFGIISICNIYWVITDASYLIEYFSVEQLFWVIADVFSLLTTITLLIISLCSVLNKINMRKIWFVPLVLEMIYALILVCMYISYELPFFEIFKFLFEELVYVAGITFVGLSLTNNFAPNISSNGAINNDNTSKDSQGYCDMTKHILLLVFIGWIWQYIWIYRTTDYLNKTPNEEKRDPITKLLLCMFVPFYYIYWIYQSARRIEIMAKEKHIDSDIVTLSVVLSLFIGIVPPIIMQSKLNQICKSENKVATVKNVEQKAEINSDKTDEIRNYKKLLDDGIITEEEFEAKKKQLLGL